MEEPRQQQKQQHNGEQKNKNVVAFFCFICISTALRSVEAGIVSSMMSEISAHLQLDYTEEGVIAAAPDYGIAPGALLAILVFRTHGKHAQTVLAGVMIGTSLITLLCCAYPSKATLILARAVGGLLWAHAATHYPVWIDKRGGNDNPKQKTLWMACTNVSLLAGILAGYILGGVVRSVMATNAITESSYDNTIWVKLYFLEAILIGACGIVVMVGFSSDMARADDQNNDDTTMEEHSNLHQTDVIINREDSSRENLMDVLGSLLSSLPFLLAVAITGCITGGVAFALYFITQVCEARGFSPNVTVILVTLCFVTAPGPGMLFGSWAVGRMGGYTDHVVTFRMALSSATVTLAATLVIAVSWMIWGQSMPCHIIFAVAAWFFFFAGGMSGPPLNGVAVSVVPRASHVASGVQFSLANTAKIVLPQLGGFICNRIGLIDGFHLTSVVCAMIFVALSYAGLVCAKKQQPATSGYERLT